VRFLRQTNADTPANELACWCRVGPLPASEMVPSFLWFILKCGLFMVGAIVFWKRPGDPSAQQFYVLCIFTLGAYMGGYHWSRIVGQPELVIGFMICAVTLPAALLHFNLVFPRPRAFLLRLPRLTLACVYGPPIVFLCVMMLNYLQIRWLLNAGAAAVEINLAINRLLSEIYIYLGVAAFWYLACVISLVQGYLSATDEMERNQVKWILFGSLLALVPISVSLLLAALEPNAFGAGAATWWMFAASTCLTAAFIIGIARYRLMQLDKIIGAGMTYFVVSFLAVAVYYVVVFLGMYIAGSRVGSPLASPLAQALSVSTTALVLMLGLDLVRNRFKKSLDRRFYRAKFQLDRTLQRMGQAIEQLVDPTTLARQLLQAAADVLGVSRGSVYVREGEPPLFRLIDALGDTPPLTELASGCPLVEAVQNSGAVLSIGGRGATGDPVQRQLRFLGGELAHPLAHEGQMVGILVLGPKEVGYYSVDDLNLLGAFTQLTALALKSAERHRTIDGLNRDLQTKVEKISEQQRRIMLLQSQLTHQAAPEEVASAPTQSSGIVGGSAMVQQLMGLVKKVSASQSAVLIRGDSGTGKELLARALHDNSPRAGKAFVKVHCAALSPGLLESELFGHVKGAFTGAHRDKMGRFEMANGGTLFLDEIGDISLDVQTKLLRVLQEMTFERVGSSEPMEVDVRVIAATHQNLEELMRAGRFREDLYYRLNVISLFVPPLRKRAEDIAELAQHFLVIHAQRCGKPIPQLDDDALARLKAYAWPGNIRQLENVIERAVVVSEGPTITVDDLPIDLLPSGDSDVSAIVERTNGAVFASLRNGLQAEREERDGRERERLVRALAAADGNKAEAARALGLARSTLLSRLKRFGLS
jgi:transcriptional regulator with GAF, ATPase, and Fis domain